MNIHCDVMIDTSQPQHAGGQQRAAIGGVLSLPDQQLPSGSRHEPRISLLTDVMAKRARPSLWRDSQQPNAVNAQADAQIRTEGSALPAHPSLAGGYESKPEISTGHRR